MQYAGMPGRSMPPPLVPQNPAAYAHVNGSMAHQPTPVKDVNIDLASLPAYDSKHYYDSEYEDSEDSQERSQGCSNWGRKHAVGSRARRNGRMPGWSRAMPTTFEESERAAKRQKRHALHPQLTFAPDAHSGLQDSLETDEDHPARARLEPPPTNPVEVLTRLSNMHTFCTPRQSSVFSGLALNAISLLETDHKCVKALNRTCSILRGDDLSWLPPERNDPLPVARLTKENDGTNAVDETKDRGSNQISEQSTSQGTRSEAQPSNAVPTPSSNAEASQTQPANGLGQQQHLREQQEADIVLGQGSASSDADLAALQTDPVATNTEMNGNGTQRKRTRESSPSAFELSVRLKQIIDPAGAVESLFVSPTPVAVPSSGSTAIVSLHEQKLLLHAGLIELSRFLADCLEYQARLREISDQVHGVDRRRRGLYTIIKRFANEYQNPGQTPHMM